MGVKKFIKKSVAFVAAAAMALTMVVAPVGAGAGVSYAEGTGSTPTDPVHVNKTAKLQSDGTYQLTLESWAEGSAKTTTTKSGTPFDIVLVLDQSGSMKGTKLTNLKSAVNTFVNNVEANAKEYNVDHRIAIAGYASDNDDGSNGTSNGYSISSGSSAKYWVNTGLFVGGKLKNYGNSKNNTNTSLTAKDYQDALVNVYDKTNDKVTSSITTAINNIAASGATRTQYGMEMANQVFANNSIDGTNRKRLVVVFTDGEPGFSSYENNEAASAISKSYATKNTYNATVYTIGCYTNSKPKSEVTNFMNYLSSNYPQANATQNGNKWTISGGDKKYSNYYQTTSDASELKKIFENISDSVTTGKTDATLSSQSIVRDIISNNFELPDNFETGNVEAYTSDYQGNGKWATPVKMSNATININKENKIIDVSGFAYDKEYTTEKAIQGRNGLGKKLIVVISNVTATKAGMQMDTNTDSSAIYNPDESGDLALVKAFPQPKVDIDSTSYVLDYGKTVKTEAKEYGVKAVTIANTGKPSPYGVNLKGTYGTFAINDGDLDYTPGKINWDGIDKGYVFGQKSSSEEYKWEQVNFMPASSVYYEDDFGTDGNGDANVAIVWTGSWGKGTSNGGQQSATNSDYGWDDSYVNDTGYSNGSAHYSSQKLASATFRFTGTGVDVYSRTNEGVGKISTSLKKVTKNADGTETVKTIKYKSIDNLSVSGDYYQIPTLNYDDLDYGTYEVTIKVITVSAENRGTYYLDGIRVYNPLGKVDDNSVAGKAYKEAGESDAQYIQVRKDLLDSSKVQAIDTAIKGSLFIDKSEEGITDIGTYKDYGPKNEVYLKADTTNNKTQGVAFNINGYSSEKNKVFIGLKSPTGKEVTVKVTSGNKTEEIKLSSAADLYYEITPTEDGNVVIENMSDNLLSITKVRITGEISTANGYALTSTPELMSYVNTFDALQQKQDTNQKDTEDTLDKGDVDINNPGDNDTNKDNSSQDNNEQTKPDNTWNKIINSIKNWFKR